MLEVFTLVVTAIATAVATTIAVRGRQFARPAISLDAGTPGLFPEKRRKRLKRLIVYGILPRQTNYILVPCCFQVCNSSSITVSDLTLRLEFPRECLPHDSVIIDRGSEMASVIRVKEAHDTRTFPMGKYVQVSTDIALLRPGESTVVPLLFKLPHNRVPDGLAEVEGASLARRIEASKMLSGVVVHASVWASNTPPIAAEFIVLATTAAGWDDMTTAVSDFSRALWDDRLPTPGLYWRARPWRRPFDMQLAEVILLKHDALDAFASDPALMLDSEPALASIKVPPWGYKGDSFDMAAYLAAVRIRGAPKSPTEPGA